MNVGLSLDTRNTPHLLMNEAFLFPPKDYFTLGRLALPGPGPVLNGLLYWTRPRGLLGYKWPIHYPTVHMELNYDIILLLQYILYLYYIHNDIIKMMNYDLVLLYVIYKQLSSPCNNLYILCICTY